MTVLGAIWEPQPSDASSGGLTAADWLPVVAALIVFVGGAVLQAWLQRKEFGDRRTHWESQQEQERAAWSDAREAERERQLLTERHRAYAAFIAALDDALNVAIRTARSTTQRAAGTPTEPGPEVRELMTRLGLADVLPPTRTAEDATWSEALSAAQTAGAQAVLLAEDDHRDLLIEALWALGSDGPDESPDDWLRSGDMMSGASSARDLRDARNGVELVARRELGITGARVTTSGITLA